MATDYKQKYEEALSKAQQLLDDDPEEALNNDDLLYIFPELKESEDEKIRKEIIAHIKWCEDSGYCAKEEMTRWITFLEKQGEQKPDDKVEPKFKAGDWVIDKQGLVHQIARVIENVTSHTYGYDIVGGGYFNDNTGGVRLWTIQDAKDGDVLYCKSNRVEFIVIVKNISKNGHIDSYCRYNTLCGFGVDIPNVMSISNNPKPATKEQRDLLFQKMHEAGYEWDAEKKQLKKIEQKPATWSEEDEKMKRTIISDGIRGAKLDMRQIKWLKSLRDRVQPQPKQEWSEEDEQTFIKSVEALEDFGKFELADWLKEYKNQFLKPQNHWKPSDEQMEAMQKALVDLCGKDEHNIITGLYYDLKKLMGE